MSVWVDGRIVEVEFEVDVEVVSMTVVGCWIMIKVLSVIAVGFGVSAV